MTLPQVLLTFANRSEGEAGHLRELVIEQYEIETALAKAVARNVCAIDLDAAITRDGLITRLQAAEAVKHVVAFHYAGHASGSALALGRGEAHAAGVAALLGRLPRLHMVFLNGCSTDAQVKALRAQGVPVVVATSVDVNDEVAKDFAKYFYGSLGAGETIAKAFESAVDAVRVQHANPKARRPVSRGSIRRKSTKPVAPTKVPWTLYPEQAPPTGADPREWSLPIAANDPLFVLPRPPLGPPDEPYRGAEPYRVEDMAIFRGRGHEIRAAYDALTQGASAVVVLTGPTGVGRTSLLNAGLLSRIQCDRDIAGVAVALPETFEEIAVAGLEVLLIDEAERLTEAQVQQALLAAPRVLLAVRDVGVAQVEAAIRAAGRAPVSVALTHLNEAAIGQVIREVTRLFPFEYSPDLPKRLATDLAGHGAAIALTEQGVRARGLPARLSHQRAAPVAEAQRAVVVGATTPITSAVLSALWWARSGELVHDTQYEKFKRDGYLDSFVKAGLDALTAENTGWVRSGFALDLLAHHMTLLGTLQGHSIGELTSRYAHREDVETFVEAACVQRLLVQTPDGRGTLLAHDLLAPLIGSRFAKSRAPAQQARRIIDERLPSWGDGAEGIVLDATDLAAVHAGRGGMHALDADGERLVDASARAVASAKQRKRAGRVMLVVAALVIVALAFVWQKQRGKAKLAASEAQVAETKRAAAEAEAAQLVRARTMSAGLVEAYRKLEDPTPQRAAAGVRQLASLVQADPALAPDVARLALRAWSGVVTDLDDASLRLARPTVVARTDGSMLVDRQGRFHALKTAPTSWFVLPGGRWVGLFNGPAENLTLYDAQTGAPGPHGPFRVPGSVEQIGVFDAPDMVLVLSHLSTQGKLWQLLVIDTQDGRGQAGRLENTDWSGHCTDDIPMIGSSASSDRVKLAFGADDQLLRADLPAQPRRTVRFLDCLQRQVDVLPPRAFAVSDLEPDWRRWSKSGRRDDARPHGGLSLFYGMPPALRDDETAQLDANGCAVGCGFARHLVRGPFPAGDQKLWIGRSDCDPAKPGHEVLRWCLSDGQSGSMLYHHDAREVHPQNGLPPIRRGDSILDYGRILRLTDLEMLDLSYAGAAWDFAVSPDRHRIALLTNRGLLRLRLNGTQYTEERRTPLNADAFLAVAWAANDVLIIQRRSGVTALRVADDVTVWNRGADAAEPYPSVGYPRQWPFTSQGESGGLAARDGVVAIRTGGEVRLVAAVDGTSLSPREYPGVQARGPVTMVFEADSTLTVIGDDGRYRRLPMPAAVRRIRMDQVADAWLKAQTQGRTTVQAKRRCVAGRAMKAGECWPDPSVRPAVAPALFAQSCDPEDARTALTEAIFQHLTTHCTPEGKGGCAHLVGSNPVFDDRSYLASATPRELLRKIGKALVSLPAGREMLVRSAAAWVHQCHGSTAWRLLVPLRYIESVLTEYEDRPAEFETCSRICEPLLLSGWARTVRASNACFEGCPSWGLSLEGPSRALRYFIHRRVLQGISVAEMRRLLRLAHTLLKKP